MDLRNTQGNWSGLQENSENMSYYRYTGKYWTMYIEVIDALISLSVC